MEWSTQILSCNDFVRTEEDFVFCEKTKNKKCPLFLVFCSFSVAIAGGIWYNSG